MSKEWMRFLALEQRLITLFKEGVKILGKGSVTVHSLSTNNLWEYWIKGTDPDGCYNTVFHDNELLSVITLINVMGIKKSAISKLQIEVEIFEDCTAILRYKIDFRDKKDNHPIIALFQQFNEAIVITKSNRTEFFEAMFVIFRMIKDRCHCTNEHDSIWTDHNAALVCKYIVG